jgi:uncharacterized BrkB/YihY/UPF0761 family membrane protein
MNMYRVTGADQTTAEDVVVSINATDKDHASSIARSRGVLVSSVELAGVVASPSIGRSRPTIDNAFIVRGGRTYLKVDQRSLVWSIALGVFFGWLLILVVVFIVWLLFMAGIIAAIGAAAGAAGPGQGP